MEIKQGEGSIQLLSVIFFIFIFYFAMVLLCWPLSTLAFWFMKCKQMLMKNCVAMREPKSENA